MKFEIKYSNSPGSSSSYACTGWRNLFHFIKHVLGERGATTTFTITASRK